MALILQTQFHKGSLIEKVSGNAFVSTIDPPTFGRFDGNYCISNTNVSKYGEHIAKLAFDWGQFSNEMTVHFYIQPFKKGTQYVGILGNTIAAVNANKYIWWLFEYTRYSYPSLTVGSASGNNIFTTDLTPYVSRKTLYSVVYSSTSNYIKLYINGVLTETIVVFYPFDFTVIDDYNFFCFGNYHAQGIYGYMRIYNNVQTLSEVQEEYQYFLNLRTHYKDVYRYEFDGNGRRIQTSLYEDFSNYAKNNIYGSSYRDNDRCIIDEKLTDVTPFLKGQNFLKNRAYNNYSYILNSNAFGSFIFYINVLAGTATLRLTFIGTKLNDSSETNVNGYYLEFNTSNMSVAIKAGGTTNLVTSVNNVYNLASVTKIEVIRTALGVFTLLVNDIQVSAVSGSNPTAANLTYTTSNFIRFNSYNMEIYKTQVTSN